VAVRPGAQVVALDLRVRGAGSAADTAGQSGAAHFVEHLTFRGAASDAPGALDAAFEALGGEASAHTSRDFVTYAVTVPKANWKEALAQLVHLVRAPAFRPGDVEAERAVILAEMALARGDTRRAGIGALAGAAFPEGDPYRLPLMGDARNVQSLTADDLRAFHAAHYLPANITLTIAGDVPPEEARKEAEALFGASSGGSSAGAPSGRTETNGGGRDTAPSPAAADAGPLQPVRSAPVETPGADLTTVHLAFRAPAAHETDAALTAEVIAALLARNGDEGYVGSALASAGEAVRVHSEYLPLCRGGLLLLSASGRGSAFDIEAALVSALVRLREDGVTEGEAAAARAARLGQAAADGERVEALAARLGYLDALGAAPDWQETYATRLSAVGPAELTRAVREWLVPARRVVAITGPGGASLSGDARVAGGR